MKNIAVLGSTGSIGESTLQVIRHLGEGYTVKVLAARSSIDLLEKQALEFRPELIAVYDEEAAMNLKKRLPQFEIVAGMEGLKAAASHSSVNFVVSAMSGTMGLVPTIAAIESGKDIGLANKEALVSGGSLVTKLAKVKNVKLLPIDSEHSAIFQCLQGEEKKFVKRLVLTASGGPFRSFSLDKLQQVRLEDALLHPTWKMGPKNTIDSSTLMNKGLEVIEAHWLFDIPVDQIEVVIHPQSVIHSMVEYCDGSIIAQMSEPSMTLPIQYAITYPQRKRAYSPPFNFLKEHHLEFYPPDYTRFPSLKLAYDSLREGGSAPGFMNAANEVLVNRFIQRELSWIDMSRKLAELMEKHQSVSLNSLDDVLTVDRSAREEAASV